MAVKDVLENLVTINGHGVFSHQKIIVPGRFHILIPDINGLDRPYTTAGGEGVSHDILFEEFLYSNGHLNYKNGWKLYLPGDDINNLQISPFNDASTCQYIKDRHEIQRELIEKCSEGYGYSNFCPLYCTRQNGTNFEYILYKGKRKLKIKACGNYTLKDILDNLEFRLSKIHPAHRINISPKENEPIVLVPFTCNAEPGAHGAQITNPFDPGNITKLNDIYYQKIIKN